MLETVFAELTFPLPEAMFLVRGNGQIMAVNAAAAAIGGINRPELSGKYIQDLVTDPPEKITAYLQACSRTKTFTPGSLTLRGDNDQASTSRCEGALLRPWSAHSEAILLLRCFAKTESSKKFIALNEQLETLKAQYQAKAIRTDQLEQRVTERTHILQATNDQLEKEISERQQVEAEREQLIETLKTLNQTTQTITAQLSLEQALETIVHAARFSIKVKYAALGIHDGQGNLSRFLTAGVTPEVYAQIGDLPVGRGLLGHLLHEGKSIIVEDIATHPSSVGFPEHHPPMRSLLGVPVFAKGELIGALYLSDKTDGSSFNDTDQQLIEMLALHAANAIENARLYEQTQRVAVLEERDRFAQDLHDGIIQSIYGVGLALDQVKADIPDSNEMAAQHIDLSLKSLATVIQELRSYIFDLRPQAMEYRDLKTRIETLIQELETNLRLSVKTNISPDLDMFINERQARHIFHICHEALSNAARHAKASQLFVSLTQEDGLVTLRVDDDGIGFERPPQINPGHRGLANIHARAQRLGAILNIDSLPQQGTRVTLTFKSTASAE